MFSDPPTKPPRNSPQTVQASRTGRVAHNEANLKRRRIQIRCRGWFPDHPLFFPKDEKLDMKMGSRRRSREIALQVLYQMEMSEALPDEAMTLYFEHFDAPVPTRPFAEQLIRGVHAHRSEIDNLITSSSEHWRLQRMSVVDRNVLRIALFEMLYCPDIPPKVSINEAVDLGKSFGSEESGAFINGILDHILPTLHRGQEAATSV